MAGEQEQTGGPGRGRDGEIVEDGCQRVNGARTGPLSLPRTHVSFFSKPGVGRKRRLQTLLLGCCVQFFIYSWLPGGLLRRVIALYLQVLNESSLQKHSNLLVKQRHFCSG